MATPTHDGARVELDPTEFDALICDLDGVVTETAQIHAAAWKETFDRFLDERASERGEASFNQFDIEQDYRRYVDGKPRYDGVKSFLASRQIELPEGSPDDPPGHGTVCALGNAKNERYLERLRAEGVEAFDDAVQLLQRARRAGLGLGLISASRNARAVLEAAELTDMFDTSIDGETALERELQGKPAPDVFLAAAHELGAEPGRSIAVEDAAAGVRAAHEGGFARVIGVSRSGGGEGLLREGADSLVRDLSEIELIAPDRLGSLPSALAELAAIARRVGDRTLVLCLDYDGTLTPIVDRPEDAHLPEATADLLGELAGTRPIAILSGRDLDDLRGMVGLEGLHYAGSHGFRIADPGGKVHEHAPAHTYLPALTQAEWALRRSIGGLDGVELERKRFAIAVHHRRAGPDAEREVEAAIDEALENFPNLRKSAGKQIFELRPDLDWDKGRALEWLMEALGHDRDSACPVYIGDDLTDEDAFAAVRASGVGIAVGDRTGRTWARYALEDPQEVAEFIEALDDRLDGHQ